MRTKQLQVIKMASPALRLRNNVVHRQMLRQEVRPTPVAAFTLRLVEHNLRFTQRAQVYLDFRLPVPSPTQAFAVFLHFFG